MGIPNRYLLHQGPVLAALGKTLVSSWTKRGASGGEAVRTFPPRPKDLVRDYVRHVGGDPSAYKRILPPHLFPQWGFAMVDQTLAGLDYPIRRALNAGCRIEVRAPLPNDQPLVVRAHVESIDDDGRRALIQQRIVTGTEDLPEALIGDLYALIPLKGGEKGKKKKKKEPARVPDGARELSYWNIRANAGLEFAKLTGDINPLHWIPAYARAAGFKNVILHGFSTMARAYEGIVRGMLSGDVGRIRMMDVQFTRPLVLPARVGLYTSTDEDGTRRVHVGDGPGGRAYLAGRFALKQSNGT